MTEQPKAAVADGRSAKIRITVRRRFTDNVLLQVWWRWSDIPKLVLAFAAALAVEVVLDSQRGMSPAEIEWSVAHIWWMLAIVVFASVSLILVLPLMIHAVSWIFGWAARIWGFTFDASGIAVSIRDTTALVPWTDVKSYAETDAALFITTKRAGIRLPKRCIDGESLRDLRALFARVGVGRASIWRFNWLPKTAA